eukprot:SAG11_NODE_2758_length_3005_cov_1.315554_4_plen_144_part_00
MKLLVLPGQVEFMSTNGTAAGHVVCCLHPLPSDAHAGQSEHAAGQTAAHESQPGPVLQSYCGSSQSQSPDPTVTPTGRVRLSESDCNSSCSLEGPYHGRIIEPRLVAGALHRSHRVLVALARAEYNQVKWLHSALPQTPIIPI